MADEVVIRLSQRERSSLAREIALAPAIPAEVGYPEVVDHGTTEGYEWMASVRVPGRNLHEIWPELKPSTRIEALADLWSRLRVLHTTDVGAARTAGCTWTRYYDLDFARAHNGLVAAVERGDLDPTTGDRLAKMLAEAFDMIPLVPVALAHTDASPGNTIWTPTGQAIPLDLESACVTPIDLELENLFRNLHFLSDRPTFSHLADLTSDLLSREGSGARLQGYAILRVLWALGAWLRRADGTADTSTCGPVLRLRSHAIGTSWLSDIC